MADTPKPIDPDRPDLEELTNVSQVHASIVNGGSAASREKYLREDGREPVNLWIFGLCGIVLLIAGSVIGAGGSFDYDEYIKDGYVTEPAPGIVDKGPTTGEALAVFNRKGAKIYSAKCGGCHQAQGQGVAGQFPPLVDSEWVTGEKTQMLAQIILNGIKGQITVAGITYNGNMPAQASGLTAEDFAGLLTYLRNSWGNDSGEVITPDMAKGAIDIYKERPANSQVTVAELEDKYNSALPGTPLAAKTIIDIETLEPVEGSEAGAQ